MLLPVLCVLDENELFCGQEYLCPVSPAKPQAAQRQTRFRLQFRAPFAELLPVCSAGPCVAVLCANWVIVCTSASCNSHAMCTVVVISCENTGLQSAHLTRMNCFKTGQMN